MVVICFAKLQFGCGIRPDQPAPDRSHPFGVPATSSNTAAVGGHKRGVGELGNPDFQLIPVFHLNDQVSGIC